MLRALSSFGGASYGRGDYLDVTGQWRNFKASSLVFSAMLAITFKGLHGVIFIEELHRELIIED